MPYDYFLQVTVRPSDVKTFKKCVEGEAQLILLEDHREGVTFRVSEGPYALDKEFEIAAKQGCVFFGCHGRGEELESRRFVAFKGEIEWAVTNLDDMLVVSVTDEGAININEVARVAKFLMLENAAEKEIGFSLLVKAWKDL